MKITNDDYTLMYEAITTHLSNFTLSEVRSLRDDYIESGTFKDGYIAFIWNVSRASGATKLIFGKGYLDAHIETALKAIFKTHEL